MTKAQLKALQWFIALERPARLFGAGDPSGIVRAKLLQAGLIEKVHPQRAWDFVGYQITAAGREQIKEWEGRRV